MRIWLDTEFNGHGGELISIGMVADDGTEFYRVIEITEEVVPWVAEHVMPNLNALAQPYGDVQQLLQQFLYRYEEVHIVADWPDDIAYFCRFLITSPGHCLQHPPLSFQIVKVYPDTEVKSVIPHNALEDAIAIRASVLDEY